jgi:isopentenyl diphosphate isomerase/L-lactate dehydrogenase-like FMN-dependent dehydrogenase
MELSYLITVNLSIASLLSDSYVYMVGGRQVDGAIPSLLALENIMESPRVKYAVERGKFTVLFDSGIRTGSDIFKAIALGAQGVLCKCTLASSLQNH